MQCVGITEVGTCQQCHYSPVTKELTRIPEYLVKNILL